MTRMTRRRFLNQSLAATSALAIAPAFARARNLNDTLGVAVVGVRGQGKGHLSAYVNDPRTTVLYVVDIDEKVGRDRCQQIAEKQDGIKPRWVADMREAFADQAVDLVSTATPNHWHALCGVWAMQAGKDVYIEKPISYDIAEGSALVAAARKYGRMCQVGTQCRSNAAVRQAVQFLADQGIGEVNFARGLCYKRRKSIGAVGDYSIPESCDFNLWSGPAPYTDPKRTRPQFHYDWHWQRHYGNGDLGNQGPHQTDIARWGLGINSHPHGILSYGGRLGYQAERNDESYVDAGDTANTEVSIYDYGDKSIVFETRGLSVDDSADEEINRLFQSNKGNKVGVIFYGSDGYLVQKTYTHCLVFDKDFNVTREFKGGGNHFHNFISACVSRRAEDLHSDAWEGHLSAGISHLGNIAYYCSEDNRVSMDEAKRLLSSAPSLDDNIATLERTEKHLRDNGVDLAKYPIAISPVMKFDPASETFPESSEATAMVRREYRDGFTCPTADKV
jgi:predicted dehydrogenase